MPNWCHCTLTVTGEAEEVATFAAKARTDEQPLSFAAHVPEPTDEEYAAIDKAAETTCYLCGGRGKRPRTQQEALILGVEFHEGVIVPLASLDNVPNCNGCSGTGQRRPPGTHEAWYEWRSENWGCKWDASFGEPFLALGAAEADVDASIEAQGATITPTVLVYKFDTPWGPPVGWLERVSDVCPELEFTLTFAEIGMDFAGRLRYVSGCLMEEDELEVDEVLMPQEMWY